MTETVQLRLGTRGSRLALAQAEMVGRLLREAVPGIEVSTIIIQTTGDKILDSSLSSIGGKGVFTREIELALLDGTIDVAVHSLKDLPTKQPAGLAIGAVTAREDPRDVLLAREPIDWRTLGPEDTIGTSSLRRRAQIRRLNKSVRVEDLRGNVPTRIRMMLEGKYTAILLAAAGIKRLAENAPFMYPLPIEEFLPAPAQGVVGLQVREGDVRVIECLSHIHNKDAFDCATAERALLQGLGGGCQLPLGALARLEGSKLILIGRILALDGSIGSEASVEGPRAKASEIGHRLAERLLAANGKAILETLDGSTGGFDEAVRRAESQQNLPLRGRTIMVTRDEDADGPLSMALRALGGLPLCVPLVKHVPPEDPLPLLNAAARVGSFDWIVFSSRRGVDTFAAMMELAGGSFDAIHSEIACVGSGTAAAVEKHGNHAALIAEGSGGALVNEFTSRGRMEGKRVLFPRADRAQPTVAAGLRALGAEVVDPVAYHTVSGPGGDIVMNELLQGRVSAIIFTSSSAADAFAAHVTDEVRECLKRVTVCSMGPTTTASLRLAGVQYCIEPTERTFEGLAQALAFFWSSGVSTNNGQGNTT